MKRNRLIYALLICLAFSGCATNRGELPVAEKICVEVQGMESPDKEFLLRKMTEYLADMKYRVVETDCDVELIYIALDHGSYLNSIKYYTEGLLTMRERDGRIVLRDEIVNLRNYKAKSYVLDALAWYLASYVYDYYQPH